MVKQVDLVEGCKKQPIPSCRFIKTWNRNMSSLRNGGCKYCKYISCELWTQCKPNISFNKHLVALKNEPKLVSRCSKLLHRTWIFNPFRTATTPYGRPSERLGPEGSGEVFLCQSSCGDGMFPQFRHPQNNDWNWAKHLRCINYQSLFMGAHSLKYPKHAFGSLSGNWYLLVLSNLFSLSNLYVYYVFLD